MGNPTLRLPRLVAALCAVCALAVPGIAFGNAEIIVVNLDAGTGQGLDDPTPAAPVGGNPGTTLGEQRFNAFQVAANIWGSFLDSSVPVRVDATFTPRDCDASSAVLGAADARPSTPASPTHRSTTGGSTPRWPTLTPARISTLPPTRSSPSSTAASTTTTVWPASTGISASTATRRGATSTS